MTFHDPLTPREHVVLGETYMKQRNYDSAGREFETAIQRDPHYVPALVALGDLAFENGEWEEAELYYQKALELSPNHPVAANNLAMLYLSQGKNSDEAERLARHALQQDTNFHPYIQETLATLYLKQGRLEEAQLAIDKAETTLRSQNPALQKRLRELRQELFNQKQILMSSPAVSANR